MMKKIILFTLLISLSTFGYSTYTIIEKVNGSPSGYKNVNEYHENNYHSLYCAEPGDLKCRFTNTTPPKIIINGTNYDIEYFEKIIDNKLEFGSNSGSLVFDNEVVLM